MTKFGLHISKVGTRLDIALLCVIYVCYFMFCYVPPNTWLDWVGMVVVTWVFINILRRIWYLTKFYLGED